MSAVHFMALLLGVRAYVESCLFTPSWVNIIYIAQYANLSHSLKMSKLTKYAKYATKGLQKL